MSKKFTVRSDEDPRGDSGEICVAISLDYVINGGAFKSSAFAGMVQIFRSPGRPEVAVE